MAGAFRMLVGLLTDYVMFQRIMWTSKLIFGGFAAVFSMALIAFSVFQAYHGAIPNPSATIAIAVLVACLPAIFAFLLFWSALVGNWESVPSEPGQSTGLLAWLRRPIGSSAVLERARTSEHPLPGDVVVEFTTYAGFLLFVTWREWKFALPPNEARQALRTMFWNTLIWGTFAYGGFFVLPMTLVNYWQQIRSIRRQEMAINAGHMKDLTTSGG